EVVLALGRMVGAGDRAQALVDGYVARLDAAEARSAARARRPRVYFEEWDDPCICAIAWVSELIALAGGVDVFAERSRSRGSAGPRVSVAEIVAAAPEGMLGSWCGKPFDAAAVRARPGMHEVPAVRDGRMHELPPEVILQPGPASLTDGLALLESLLAEAST